MIIQVNSMTNSNLYTKTKYDNRLQRINYYFIKNYSIRGQHITICSIILFSYGLIHKYYLLEEGRRTRTIGVKKSCPNVSHPPECA